MNDNATEVQPTRVTKKISDDAPPSVPFLHFDRIVGRGGMAVVWRAWHNELNKFVAVKVLDKNLALTGRDLRQFMVEVKTMSSLNHQGIVRGYGADCADGRYYFIMDYVDGYTFGSLLKRKSRLPQIDALIICESVADAMKYAWDEFGIIHCDIKPDNIMVDRDGTVKVLDLGLCQSTAVLKTSTQIIIAPGYKYHIVKMMVTNFHQPQSTLLLLVSAFVNGDWKIIYRYALSHDFRFLSYGDSSLLIP